MLPTVHCGLTYVNISEQLLLQIVKYYYDRYWGYCKWGGFQVADYGHKSSSRSIAYPKWAKALIVGDGEWEGRWFWPMFMGYLYTNFYSKISQILFRDMFQELSCSCLQTYTYARHAMPNGYLETTLLISLHNPCVSRDICLQNTLLAGTYPDTP